MMLGVVAPVGSPPFEMVCIYSQTQFFTQKMTMA